MNILMVNNERQDFSGRVTHWEGHRIRYTSAGYADVMKLPVRTGMCIDTAALEALLDSAKRTDAVWCESPEALLMWYVLKKRRRRVPPFVIEDEDLLSRVKALAEWISSFYGIDPLPEFLADARNVWMHHNRAHGKIYRKAGIGAERLVHLPCSSYLVSAISEDAWILLSNGVAETKTRKRPLVLCPGANRRDYETLSLAVEGLDCETVALGYRERTPAANIKWKRFVPLEEFIMRLAAADVVAVPLADEAMSGGENSISFAMALGRAVVATDSTGARELIKHGRTGLLVPPRDPAALRDAITALLDDARLRERIGEAAKKAEVRNAEKTRHALLRAFSLAG